MSNGVDFKKIALENRDLLNAALAREAALREELEIIRPERDLYKTSSETMEDFWHEVQKRLTVSEQRVGELAGLLRTSRAKLSFDPKDILAIDAALKPAEEGEGA